MMEPYGILGRFYALMWMTITWVYMWVKNYRAEHLRFVHSILCVLSLNEKM